MPSKSFIKFEADLLIEVERIIQSHKDLNKYDTRGRRGLGHITRSGILMLCASWEVYIEELLCETVKYFCENVDDPKKLNKSVQKEIAFYVRNSRNELKAIELAGEGWKNIYLNDCNETIWSFNTPKSINIDSLYKRFLGIENLSEKWSMGKEIIDEFVSDRGEIAHKGRLAKYITIVNLKNYFDIVKKTAIETDNYIADFVQNNCDCNRSPWRRRNI